MFAYLFMEADCAKREKKINEMHFSLGTLFLKKNKSALTFGIMVDMYSFCNSKYDWL